MSVTRPALGAAYDPRVAALEPAAAGLPPVPVERLAARALRDRFRAPPQWAPELPGDRFRLSNAAPRPAAVLVPVVAHPHPTVLLTQRTAHLDKHAGQIAFPGGRTDRDDRSPVDTALRETEEEVGLPRSRIEVIGQLPEYETGTGFRVTPVVGLVDPGFDLQLDAFEVEEAFEVPLAFLMDPANHQRRLVDIAGTSRSFFAMPYRHAEREREYFIWGATAAMLRNLYRFLAA